MKLEHLLKIYWTRGLYYDGKLHNFDWSVTTMFKNLKGLSDYTQLNFIKRFEYGYFFKNNLKRNFEMSAFGPLRYKIFNAYISKIMNTNRSINELIRLNAIRLYLIKTFRGRARALGKPSRGQRTWSNAWNAYKCDNPLKKFIANLVRLKRLKTKPKKINYRLIEKKLRKPIFKIKPLKPLTKKNLWF